jgi:hypothetical protein
VKEVLSEYNHLGVPHFQRGLVWDTDSVALLLESIYYGTPCGSIILWKPSNIAAYGIPLGSSAPRFLIVDGQQRIRSLHAVFAGHDSASATAALDDQDEGDDAVETPDDDPDEQEQGIWCLNLGRLPETKHDFRGAKYRLFRRAIDPRRRSADTSKSEAAVEDPDRQPLVPLRWFLHLLDTKTDAEIRRRIEGLDPAIKSAVKALLKNDKVLNRLREMMTAQVFDLTVLEPDSATSELQDVVGVYVRINSAGQRVEAEERAFANVVGEYQGASGALKKFFDATHGVDPTPNSKALPRDDLLRRQRENRFGFKLFMRTFVIVLAYHSDRKNGASGFSFEMASAESMAKAGTQLPSLLDDTETILEGVANILRDPPLFCDDFRMLSETASLWPLIHLLVRFPGLMPSHKHLLAPIALRLLLADLSKRELLKLSDRVVRAQTPTAALAFFSTSVLSSRSIRKAIDKGVGRRSLTNRYTLMLYWLLRSRGAKDFDYAFNLPDGGAAIKSRYGIAHEAELIEKVQPQKQHLVPYARLKEIFDLVGARPGRSEAHDIGNLTYISAALNDLTGLSARPLQLQHEPPENREAHLLKKAFLAAFKKACDADLKTAKTNYAAFCSSRRKLIVDELVKWEQTARTAGGAPAPDLTPLTRRIKQRDDDVIRGLGYSPTVTGLLYELSVQHSLERGRSKDARWSIVRKLKTAPRTYHQVWRIELWSAGKIIRLKLDDDVLLSGFKRRFPTIPLHSRKGDNPAKAQTIATETKTKQKCDLALDEQMVKVLRWISAQA